MAEIKATQLRLMREGGALPTDTLIWTDSAMRLLKKYRNVTAVGLGIVGVAAFAVASSTHLSNTKARILNGN